MLIQTSQQRRPSRVTAAARLDQKLAQGELPQDVFILPSSQPQVLDKAEPGALPVGTEPEGLRWSRRHALVSTSVFATLTGGVGAAMGMMAIPGSPLLGSAIGAGVGVALGVDTFRDMRGKVNVNQDGETSTRRWYGSPKSFKKTPQELRAVLHATGALGDRIEAVPFPRQEGDTDPQRLAELAPHRETLKELAEQRRLVADFGSHSRYGKAALQMVDLGQARELLGRGKPVQVVTVGEIQDQPHQLTTEAQSGTHHRKEIRDYHYVERQFDYQLQTIREAEDLKGIKEGAGLPDSTVGVPLEGGIFKQTVYSREASGERTISKEGDRQHESLREFLVGEGSKAKSSSPAASALKSMVDPSTRGYAIVGGVVGLVAGAALSGIEPAVGVTLGAVGGHFVGRAAVARTAENRSSNKTLNKVLIGAGAAAGVGLSLLAAAQTGNHAVVGCGFIGLVGGFSGGALAGRKMSKGAMGNMAMGGLCVGSLTGIYAAHAAGPVATVAMGALGAVAGGTLAWMATRRKV